MWVRLADRERIPVRIVRRSQKRCVLHMDPQTGSFWMSAPISTPAALLQVFLEGQEGWIRDQHERFRQRASRGVVRCCGRDCALLFRIGRGQIAFDGGRFTVTAPTYAAAERLFLLWWDKQALGCCNRHVDAWMPLFQLLDVARPEICVRPLSSAWGVCFRDLGRIHFARQLYCVPDSLVDYVVLHELTHLVHPDHGGEFRAFLSKWMPDWISRRSALKEEQRCMRPWWPPDKEPDVILI